MLIMYFHCKQQKNKTSSLRRCKKSKEMADTKRVSLQSEITKGIWNLKAINVMKTKQIVFIEDKKL